MVSKTLTYVTDKSSRAQGCATEKSESASGLSGGIFEPFIHSFRKTEMLKSLLEGIILKGLLKWMFKIIQKGKEK